MVMYVRVEFPRKH